MLLEAIYLRALQFVLFAMVSALSKVLPHPCALRFPFNAVNAIFPTDLALVMSFTCCAGFLRGVRDEVRVFAVVCSRSVTALASQPTFSTPHARSKRRACCKQQPRFDGFRRIKLLLFLNQPVRVAVWVV